MERILYDLRLEAELPLVSDVSVDLASALRILRAIQPVGVSLKHLRHRRVNHVPVPSLDTDTNQLTRYGTANEDHTPVVVSQHRSARHRAFGPNLHEC